jgi:peptide/nickel transport system substrate-binding protein
MSQNLTIRGYSHFLRSAAPLIVVALTLLSCAPTTAPARSGGSEGSPGAVATSAPKTLRIGMQTSDEPNNRAGDGVVSPAPYGGSGSGSAQLEHFFMFHSALTAFDPQRNLIPRLAQKVPTIDDGDWKILPAGGMEVTWKIKPNLTWQDGSPLTADDFAFGYQVASDPELAVPPRGDYANIIDVQAVDSQTLLVRWKSQSIFGNVNGQEGVPAVSHHVFGELYAAGDKASFENSSLWNQQWVGLGPYRITRWAQGSEIDAQAFDGYVMGRPKIDRIIIRYVGDVNALVANVLSGDIDLIPAGAQLDIGQMVTLRQAWEGDAAGYTLLNTKSVRTLYLQMRDPAAPWARDVRIRQALLQALNRDEIVETLLFGLVPRADFYVTPQDPVYGLAQQRGLPTYPYDLAQAERQLADAGWSRGADRVFRNAAGQPFQIDVTASGQGDNVTEAVTVAGHWSAAGFQSSPTPYPANADNAAEIRHSTKGALIWPWNFTVIDPRTVASTEIGSAANRWRGGNYGGYSNAAYDGLWSQLTNQLNPTERQETLFQMIKILDEELPVLPMFYRATGLAARKGIDGPTATPPIQAASMWNLYAWDYKS